MNPIRLHSGRLHPMSMLYFPTVALLGCIAIAQSPSPAIKTTHPPTADSASILKLPKGKTTVMGGEIRNVDHVRDQLTLKVFGGHAVKILFDERTSVSKNGKKVDILDLSPDKHASIETASDGSSIFAVKISMLSHLPDDDFRGRVTAYSSQTHALTIVTSPGNRSLTVDVPVGTPIASIAQDGSSTPEQGSPNFTSGSLVDVTLTGGKGKNGVATKVNVLAVPGTTFVFAGKLSVLDVHAGKIVVLDPRDNQSYPITFGTSLLPVARKLRQGAPVKVTTTYTGKDYVASEITPE